MSIYTVDVHQIVHTCPGSNEPHTIDSRRTLVAVTSGGPCRNPITVTGSNTTIDCGRLLPAERQCVACKTLVIIRNTTIEDLGHQAAASRTAHEVNQ